MPETIAVRKLDGTIWKELPILKKLKLFGVSGFALHHDPERPALLSISHIETGFRVGSRAYTEQAVREACSEKIRKEAKRFNITPEQMVLDAVERAALTIKR